MLVLKSYQQFPIKLRIQQTSLVKDNLVQLYKQNDNTVSDLCTDLTGHLHDDNSS